LNSKKNYKALLFGLRMVYLIGVDDAGRGPVLGPMVLAGVLIKDTEEEELKKLGVKDSKLLLPKKRGEICSKIKGKYAWHAEVTYPKEIDESPNLNLTEAIKAGMVINSLMKDINEKTRVIVDCPSVNLKAWCETLSKFIEKKELVELLCEHKADFNHAVVGAGSIIAKEKREEEVERLKKELGVDFGSGYPADPKTKEFLQENWDNEKYSELIRKSWDTYKRIVEGRGQKKLF